jgi:hypothetical protein
MYACDTFVTENEKKGKKKESKESHVISYRSWSKAEKEKLSSKWKISREGKGLENMYENLYLQLVKEAENAEHRETKTEGAIKLT